MMNLRRWIGLAMFVSLVSAAVSAAGESGAAQPPAAAQAQELRGVVVDGVGHPMPGAEIQVLRLGHDARGRAVPEALPLGRAQADDRGRFVARAPLEPSTRYLLRAAAAGTAYGLLIWSPSRSHGGPFHCPLRSQSLQEPSIILLPAARLEGVVCAPNGEPLAGAEVCDLATTVHTGPDGRFVFDRALPPAWGVFLPQRELTARHPQVGQIHLDLQNLPVGGLDERGRLRLTLEASADPALEHRRPLPAPPPVVAAPPAAPPAVRDDPRQRDGVKVRGRVVDAQGRPVPLAKLAVHLPGPRGSHPPFNRTVYWFARDHPHADLEGRFEFDAPVTPGIQPVLRAWSPTLEQAASVDLPLGAPADAPLEVRLTPTGRVSGRVRDPQGRGVPGARVAFEHSSHNRSPGSWRSTMVVSTITDGDGRYTLSGYQPHSADQRVDLGVISFPPASAPESRGRRSFSTYEHLVLAPEARLSGFDFVVSPDGTTRAERAEE